VGVLEKCAEALRNTKAGQQLNLWIATSTPVGQSSCFLPIFRQNQKEHILNISDKKKPQ